jgi:inhibitor of cysteine peptidase
MALERCWILVAWLLAAFAMAGDPAQIDLSAARGPGVTVSDDANGRTVHLQSGQILTVRLEANATTGYRWSVLSGTGECLGLTSDNYRESQSSAVGRGGTAVFVFTAMQAGTTELKLGYSRPFEPHAPPARTYSLRVTIQGGGQSG